MNNQRPTGFLKLTLAILVAALAGQQVQAQTKTNAAQEEPIRLPPAPPGVVARLSTNISAPVSGIAPPPPPMPVIAPRSGPNPMPFGSITVHLTATITNDLLNISWQKEVGGALLYQKSGTSTRWDPVPANLYQTNAREISVTLPAPILTTYYRVGLSPEAPTPQKSRPTLTAPNRPPTRAQPVEPPIP
jgi:hypothetical protein